MICVRDLKREIAYSLSTVDDRRRVQLVRRRFNRFAQGKLSNELVPRSTLERLLGGEGTNSVFVSVMRHSEDCKQINFMPNQWLPSPLTRKGEYERTGTAKNMPPSFTNKWGI